MNKESKKQFRQELLLCLIEQDFFDFKEYVKSIDKLKKTNGINPLEDIQKQFFINVMHQYIRNDLDKLIIKEGINENKKPKKVKCIYCKKPIHISKWAGVNKKGFVCDDVECLKKLAKEIKK